MYTALATRPDIAFTVAAPSRYNSAPFTTHMASAKRVLRYLCKTAHFACIFQQYQQHPSPSPGTSEARTKHIDVRYYNCRDLHSQGILAFTYVHTNNNIADIMTKALSVGKHRKFMALMGCSRQQDQ
jgi:hypothetical protein